MGSYLSAAKEDCHPEDGSCGPLSFAANAMQGWRITMEDAHFMTVEDQYAAFGVFDGHGGRAVAIYCANHLPRVLKERHAALVAQNGGQPLEDAAVRTLLDGTFRATDQLMRQREGCEELAVYKADSNAPADRLEVPDDIAHSQGCTGVMVYLCFKTNKIYCANAGDSRAVLCEGTRTVALSDDHKPTNAGELARIERNGGTVSEEGRVCGNLNLSRAFGDFTYKKPEDVEEEHLISVVPDIEVCQLTRDHKFVVLGCDGIWELQSNEQVVENVLATLDRVGTQHRDIFPEQPQLSETERGRQREERRQRQMLLMVLGHADSAATNDEDEVSRPPRRLAPEAALGGHSLVHHGKQWDSVSSEEEKELVEDGKLVGYERKWKLSDCAAQVLRDSLSPNTEATGGHGCDNMTCMVVDLRRLTASL